VPTPNRGCSPKLDTSKLFDEDFPTPFRLKPLGNLIFDFYNNSFGDCMTTKSRLACFCVVLIALLAAPATWAQAASKFDLPSQSLAASLRAVGSQATVNVLFDRPLVEGLQAPALTAALTTDQAFAQLLAGTKLKYRYLDSKNGHGRIGC
jgi:hypothetical protein